MGHLLPIPTIKIPGKHGTLGDNIFLKCFIKHKASDLDQSTNGIQLNQNILMFLHELIRVELKYHY